MFSCFQQETVRMGLYDKNVTVLNISSYERF